MVIVVPGLRRDDVWIPTFAGMTQRVAFSKVSYLDPELKVVYTSIDGKSSNVYPVLKWLANLCSHIPSG